MEVISFFVVFRKWLFKQSTTYRGNWAHLVHFHPPTPPPLSFFPHLPPSYSAWGRTMSGWSEPLLTQCSPSVTILVAGEGNGIKLPNWAIKGYFCPCMPVSVGSCSKYRSGTSDANETCPPFHWFKSTYVIPSSDQQELAIPYHLGLILQLSLPVITLLPTQSCPVFYFFFFLFLFFTLGGQVHEGKSGSMGERSNVFPFGWWHSSKKSTLGVTYEYPAVPVHSYGREVTDL